MAKPSSWLTSQNRPGRTMRPKTLTNNPERGSNNWGGLRGRGYGKLSIRRLMKVDPSNAQGTPDAQTMVGVNGVVGRTGRTVARVIGRSETKRTVSGTGVTRIRNKGVNRSLKKR